jgi:hypothetical protein
MSNNLPTSIKALNFKCFKDEQGFDDIKPINLIIGRNNSGKSTLLDLIEASIRGKPVDAATRSGRAEIVSEGELTEQMVQSVFQRNASGGSINGNHFNFGSRLIGSHLKWAVEASDPSKKRAISIGPSKMGDYPLKSLDHGAASGFMQTLASLFESPLRGKAFRRIFAERNITPEGDDPSMNGPMGDGRGITNIIQCFINKSKLPSDLVEVTLLNELNKVFSPDAQFIDIVCQHLENNSWEIYLEEKEKGRIPLSQSGSGLKTILTVLVHLYLIPFIDKRPLEHYVFAFEELENNLHPALLRRLLNYLDMKAKDELCTFFLTTHSNVEIDLFSKRDDAQIIHVTHDGTAATCRTVRTYIDNKGVLDDLDVRASDLLQSNAIVWVEGPSDRIYINRWIQLWTDGALQEGAHYQCVFYGGRLLAHLSSDDPDAVESGIAMLRVNRNAAIVIDSDRRTAEADINSTKKRLISEFDSMSGISWVTDGREIENYITGDVIRSCYGNEAAHDLSQYEDFFDYLNTVSADEGKRYSKRKSLLAEKLVPYMTKQNICEQPSLASHLKKLCEAIVQWNGSR